MDKISELAGPGFVPGVITVLAAWQLSKLVLTPREPEIVKAPVRQPTSAYPPDFYPGSKIVETPYGNIQAYEFGPTDGERVLFVHGITTPCAVFKGILGKMADAGYRVCAFDLWGRGGSDSPEPKHDERLFCTQILCVLQNVGWSKCSIVGYSLGGCLTSSFASYFPNTVDKLIIIAPAGLLSRQKQNLSRKIALSEYTPFALIRLLQKFVVPKAKEAVEQIAPGRVDVSKVSTWQTEHHKGFYRSYLSTFRYAPIFDQWPLFERLRRTKLPVYAIWGADDDVVPTSFCSANLKKALPEVQLTIIPDVAHDICTAKPQEVLNKILEILA